MESKFNEVLSALRKERKLSQRAAAAQLGVSQALLSHYEKGVREPGLNFISNVCDLYGVSADYLLGRSALRTSLIFSENELKNTVSTLEAAVSFFSSLSELESDELREDLISLCSAFFYKLYRLSGIDSGNVSAGKTAALCDSLLHLRQAQLLEKLPAEGGSFILPEDFIRRVEEELAILFNE